MRSPVSNQSRERFLAFSLNHPKLRQSKQDPPLILPMGRHIFMGLGTPLEMAARAVPDTLLMRKGRPN